MDVLTKEAEASHWGIEPVPDRLRKFSGFDLGVLWGDLGIGLLVIIAGALLVAPPDAFGFGLSLPAALTAIAIGSTLGCILLALGGLIGTREGMPTMVLMRTVLGIQGSWIPTVLNVIQLIGWTSFELWAMALVAHRLGSKIFGFSSFVLWLVVFAAVVMFLAVWGPLGVVRTWMEKFGVWLIVLIGAVITVYLLGHVDFGAVFGAGGAGGSAILGPPLDLVIVMPVSWIPLVADYNRFSITPRGSVRGTFIGYLLANIWFYALGALMVLGLPDASPGPQGIAAGILAIGGVAFTGIVLLAGLLVGETDEAFADVYSASVSIRNIAPKLDGRILVAIVTVLGALIAGRLSMDSYELFLFLLGSFFVPLLGVWFADYFVLNNRPPARSRLRVLSMIPWVVGFAVYHAIVPTGPSWWTGLVGRLIGEPLSLTAPWLNASLPSFLSAFLIHLGIGSLRQRRKSQS